MKAFVALIAIVLITVVAVNAADDMKARWKEIGEACGKENGVSPEDAEKFHTGTLKPNEVKDNMKCATNCVMVKLGFMNEGGKFNADAVKAAFKDAENKDQAIQAVDKCKGLQGANPCDTAFQIITCLMKEKLDAM